MNNKLGLKETDIESICMILNHYSEVEKAYIFGSRAKGNYKTGSDVDIALKGKLLSSTLINRISYELNENTNMPYQFGLLNYETLNTPELIAHIDRVGIIIYSR